jgi:hypothetical protein
MGRSGPSAQLGEVRSFISPICLVHVTAVTFASLKRVRKGKPGQARRRYFLLQQGEVVRMAEAEVR